MKNNKKIAVLIFILILVVQIIAIVYAASQREWLHMDEIYSFGLMQYEEAFIFEEESFLNNWHNAEYFKDYLIINEDEKYDFSAVYENQIKDVHPPIYYLLLRIASSFNIDKFSIWPGTILNIVLYVFSSVFLYLISKRIFNNNWCPLLVCLLNGFSMAAIETAIYIRMYQLFILNILMLIYWHVIKSDKQNLNLKSDLLVLYIMVIVGFLSHYYYAIFAVILYIMYVIKFIKNKNYKDLWKYTATLMAAALTAILIFPYCINHIFFSYRGEGVISNALNIFSFKFFSAIVLNLQIFNSEILNGNLVNIVAMIIFLLLILIVKNKSRKEIIKNDNLKYIIIPLVTYLFISILISPYKDIRYLMPIVPLVFICILYLFYYLLKSILTNKQTLVILLILVMVFCMTLVPKLSNTSYTFKELKNFTELIQNDLKDKPCIYLFTDETAEHSKMSEIYPMFAMLDETYVVLDIEVSSNKIEEALKGKDISNGVIVISYSSQRDELVEKIMESNLFDDNVLLCTVRHYSINLLN